MRVEVCYAKPGLDGRGAKILKSLTHQGAQTPFTGCETLDTILLEEDLDPLLLSQTFADPVVQKALFDNQGPEKSPLPDWTYLIEVSYKAGVANPMAMTAKEALQTALGREWKDSSPVQTAVTYLFKTNRNLTVEELNVLKSSFYNPLIQQAVAVSRSEWNNGKRLPELYPLVALAKAPDALTVPLLHLNHQELVELSTKRLLALTLEEMLSVQNYFKDPQTQKTRQKLGLSAEPTDVELEMIAQTWSEHCKHKIFSADVDYEDSTTGKKETIHSLYASYIKQTTKDLTPQKPFLKSVFHDNSGVLQFDADTYVCFKVETHNSPSALDPFGGAITGIVGVNRDILGTGKGAKPIFNTDFLCFGDPRTPQEEIPQGLLHPKTVLKGVHQGIIEGGNHSGIPTVAGGFLFDESYKGKPLVFCGTGGILPAIVNGEDSCIKHIEAGDLTVMLGGRIGKDGIHGATFSSLALDEASPTSAVQIGDPITQKKMLDFLLEARDLDLYKGITDNGAGGLSSSLGEMAESSGGIHIDLEKCPLKYQGLAPWEILVSESQERMSLAVSSEKIEAFLALAKKRDVEGAVVGHFTNSGLVEIFYQGHGVGSLSMEFLHKGLPTLHLKARWVPPVRQEIAEPENLDLKVALLSVLADPSVASKETLVRQYDHEVQNRSVIKPFCGEKSDGPTDGAVLQLKPWSTKGLTVTHGICPRYGDVDTYQMAMNAVDEAYRSHIILGGDPDFASVLDNFCWPDPVESEKTPDGAYKMAQLVRTCQGLREACLAYGLPLISGKDSMKNDAVMNGKKVSIRPTLLVSLMGIIPDVTQACSSDFLKAGDLVCIIGETRAELAGSILEKVTATTLAGVPKVKPNKVLGYYKNLNHAIRSGWVQSAHDLSEGGLAAALAESCIGGRLGAHITLDEFPGFTRNQLTDTQILFSESPSRFLVTLSSDHLEEFTKLMGHAPWAMIGVVTDSPLLVVDSRRKTVISAKMEELLAAWNSLTALL